MSDLAFALTSRRESLQPPSFLPGLRFARRATGRRRAHGRRRGRARVDVVFGGVVLATSYGIATLAFVAIGSAFGWILRDFRPPVGRSARGALFASTLLSTLLLIG